MLKKQCEFNEIPKQILKNTLHPIFQATSRAIKPFKIHKKINII